MPVDTRPAVGLLVVVYYLPQDHQSPGINLQLLRSWKVRICLCCVPENYGPFRVNYPHLKEGACESADPQIIPARRIVRHGTVRATEYNRLSPVLRPA